MIILTSIMCMAINLYHECRSTSDLECQYVNKVVINRVEKYHKDACQIIFAQDQFSWTNNYSYRKNFHNWKEIINYYDLYESPEIFRAFVNVTSSVNKLWGITDNNIIYYHDKTEHPWWIKDVRLVYDTYNFKFYKEK